MILAFFALVGLLPVESLEPHEGSTQPSGEAAGTETAIGQSCDIIVTVQAGGYHDKVRALREPPPHELSRLIGFLTLACALLPRTSPGLSWTKLVPSAGVGHIVSCGMLAAAQAHCFVRY